MAKFSKSFKCGQCYRIWSTSGILDTHTHEPSIGQLHARTFYNAAPQSEPDYRTATTITHTSSTLGINSVCFDVNLLADVVLYVIVYCVSISLFNMGTHANRTAFYSFVKPKNCVLRTEFLPKNCIYRFWKFWMNNFTLIPL